MPAQKKSVHNYLNCRGGELLEHLIIMKWCGNTPTAHIPFRERHSQFPPSWRMGRRSKVTSNNLTHIFHCLPRGRRVGKVLMYVLLSHFQRNRSLGERWRVCASPRPLRPPRP